MTINTFTTQRSFILSYMVFNGCGTGWQALCGFGLPYFSYLDDYTTFEIIKIYMNFALISNNVKKSAISTFIFLYRNRWKIIHPILC